MPTMEDKGEHLMGHLHYEVDLELKDKVQVTADNQFVGRYSPVRLPSNPQLTSSVFPSP